MSVAGVEIGGRESAAPPKHGRLRRLARPGVLFGAVLLGILATCAIAPSLLAPHNPNTLSPHQLLPPVWAGGRASFPLGTDSLGRDVLSRLIFGARTSVAIAGGAVIVAALVGGAVGLITGYFGGVVETALMRLGDIQLAFPFMVLALALLGTAQHKGIFRLLIVLAIADWVVHARVVRARTLTERGKEYVPAARALGASHLRVVRKYVLPNVLPTMIIMTLLEFAGLALVEPMLAFIGLGVDPPNVSWGTLISDGAQNVTTAWWLIAFPSAAIFLTVLAANLLAGGLSDALDPGTRRRSRLKACHVSTAKPRASAALEPPGRPDGPRHGGGASLPLSDPGPVLQVNELHVEFAAEDDRVVTAVKGISFDVLAGERLGLVGESGSGKSVTALAILGLLGAGGRVSGSVKINGTELLGSSSRFIRSIRGSRIAMIFQDPGTALNPSMRVGAQIAEAVRIHQEVSREQASEAAVAALSTVNINDPARVARAYPFELSGGMQQRVMIAMALSCRPDVLIADEPTTALDVTTQAQILRELDRVTRELGTAIILVSHDLGVVAEFTERLVVMRTGEVCEAGETATVVRAPRAEYTRSLLEASEAVEPFGPATEGNAPCSGRSEEGNVVTRS